MPIFPYRLGDCEHVSPSQPLSNEVICPTCRHIIDNDNNPCGYCNHPIRRPSSPITPSPPNSPPGSHGVQS
jgi:hypothetical protein